MSLRDANVIIIETSRTTVRAGIGLYDLLKTPSIEIPARVGLRRGASGDTSALARGESVFDAATAASSRAASAMPQPLKAAVTDYLVGTQLDEAIAAGQDIIISWPFAKGDIADWAQAEAIWKHILFNQLQRRRVQNESPVLLSIVPGLSRSTYERICQMFFERFNVAGFGIIERPMAQMYAANSLSGVVVEIGDYETDITPIYDGFIVHQAKARVSLGLKDCEIYLAYILRLNQNIVNILSPPETPLDPETLQERLLQLAQQLWKDGHIKVPSDGETAIPDDEGVTDIAAIVVAGKEKAVIESGMKKKATAKATAAELARAREIEAMDLLTVQFGPHSLTLGKERHRMCEPLFDPRLLKGLSGLPLREGDESPRSLQEVTAHAVNITDVDQRMYIWQGLLVTGDATRCVKGIGLALQSRLAPFLYSPESSMDIQPRSIRVLGVPEYYAEYRETGNSYAAFLGSSITAKIIFNDNGGRSYVSKSEYASKGPHSIIDMTPALI
ncbi:actin-related protein [Macrolepiota fuliginosa MF-IS2]|uniref:Actin-related protein n=1 Tax=Macrolepiota fuliginosa MF-IS2 TaxID=1400762 RepID=A0A9P5XAL7_9AGAR|nr:actin-related protein [Macrolepiota fuliginosa MF-IS2]